MPPYRSPIYTFGCQADGCGKQAAFEVFNTKNALMGRYCDAHSKAKLKELERGG